jgi:HAD superfamily hydrolase (TIGR01490 family)
MEAAFFDLDKTIVARSALLAFGRPLYRAGLLSRRAIVRGAYAQVVFMLLGAGDERMEKMRSAMLSLTRGWSRDHITEIVRDTLDDVVAPIVYSEAIELIRQHQEAGRLVVIVSSSPEEVVQPMAAHLGVDVSISSRAAVDDTGLYTGRLAFYAYGPQKVAAMHALATEHGIDLAASFAYSDSVTDVPMLEAVGHPVAVNADRDLARIARERGWEIRTFRELVGLPSDDDTSHYRSHTRSLATAALAGAVVTATIGVVGWWRGRTHLGADRS